MVHFIQRRLCIEIWPDFHPNWHKMRIPNQTPVVGALNCNKMTQLLETIGFGWRRKGGDNHVILTFQFLFLVILLLWYNLLNAEILLNLFFSINIIFRKSNGGTSCFSAVLVVGQLLLSVAGSAVHFIPMHSFNRHKSDSTAEKEKNLRNHKQKSEFLVLLLCGHRQRVMGVEITREDKRVIWRYECNNSDCTICMNAPKTVCLSLSRFGPFFSSAELRMDGHSIDSENESISQMICKCGCTDNNNNSWIGSVSQSRTEGNAIWESNSLFW